MLADLVVSCPTFPYDVMSMSTLRCRSAYKHSAVAWKGHASQCSSQTDTRHILVPYPCLAWHAEEVAPPTYSVLRGVQGSSQSAQGVLALKGLQDVRNGCFIFTLRVCGVSHRLLPARVSEIIGVCHLKAYVFDNDVLLSGANLSTIYFTKRQDRYFLFKGMDHLANFIRTLIQALPSSYT